MATKSIAWNTGSGNISINYTGEGNGTIEITCDNNNLYEARSQQITVNTTDGSNIERVLTIQQAAKVRIDISTAVVTASNQTYSGSAKTPTPTVTLNGETIPSSGYDVAYSDNTNAGTATITVTGKDDYTGTATGTFTIAKASPNYTAPAARTNLTYSGNSQYLTTSGSTSDGTIQYSADGTSWSTTRVTKTTAGTYTTYWRLVGDSNHNDVASTSLSTTIAKASRTLSFADAYVVLAPSGNVTKTATPSAGSGEGAITYSISSTTYATINSSSGKVTAKTSDGSAIVTATIAEGTNYLSATASYNLYVFATTHNYDYNGSYRSVTLPPGTYQFQCWGAQGGSNAAASSYSITAQSGGKGGYSVGQLTVSQATAVRVYVGGQGSSSAGGFNGGGSTSGSSSYNSGDTYGTSRMGGGGGATDIRLSDGALLSRMIVAGGGSGGAMCYQQVTTTTYEWERKHSSTTDIWKHAYQQANSRYIVYTNFASTSSGTYFDYGKTVRITFSGTGESSITGTEVDYYNGSTYISGVTWMDNNGGQFTVPNKGQDRVTVNFITSNNQDLSGSVIIENLESSSSTTTDTNNQVGYVGGGTNGGGYSSTYYGKQNGAGSGGSFGQGANQSTTNYRYCSGAGGGGWYGGGGGQYSDSFMDYCKYSGGGSGFVNTAASAGNRPSGYTGLQLDSGSTTAGSSSFPAPGGGNETGHAGNGYARITRL